MRKPVLTIFYQFNPWHTTIGGIQTVISLFIKYAPSEFEVRLVGTGNDEAQPTLVWQEAELAGRAVRFLPLLTLPDDNVRRVVPTTVKYTAALMGRCFASDFMHFQGIDPALVASLNSNPFAITKTHDTPIIPFEMTDCVGLLPYNAYSTS